MEYEDIFEKANELINCLGLVDSEDLINYITNSIIMNEECNNKGYRKFLYKKYARL